MPEIPLPMRPFFSTTVEEHIAYLEEKQRRCWTMCNEFKYAMHGASVGWGGFTNAVAAYLNLEPENQLAAIVRMQEANAPPAQAFTDSDLIKAEEELAEAEKQVEVMEQTQESDELPKSVRAMWEIVIMPNLRRMVGYQRDKRDQIQRALEEQHKRATEQQPAEEPAAIDPMIGKIITGEAEWPAMPDRIPLGVSPAQLGVAPDELKPTEEEPHE